MGVGTRGHQGTTLEARVHDRQAADSACRQQAGRNGQSRFRMICVGTISLFAFWIQGGDGQLLCPGSRTQHCNSCPDQCSGPDVCLRNQRDYIKCRGSSWGNTNSTFMDVACGAPPGSPPDSFPLPAIITPSISAPLLCNGTIQRGQWPFDADNMTFFLDNTFRDPLQPESPINTEFLPCLTLGLKPVSASYLGQTASAHLPW